MTPAIWFVPINPPIQTILDGNGVPFVHVGGRGTVNMHNNRYEGDSCAPSAPSDNRGRRNEDPGVDGKRLGCQTHFSTSHSYEP